MNLEEKGHISEKKLQHFTEIMFVFIKTGKFRECTMYKDQSKKCWTEKLMKVIKIFLFLVRNYSLLGQEGFTEDSLQRILLHSFS